VKSIDYGWLLPDHVALVACHGNLSLSDMQSADEWLKRSIDRSKAERVHVIADATNLGVQYPSLHVQMQNKALRHARLGWILTIQATGDPMRRFYLHMITIAAGKQYRDFHTLTHALSFLNQSEAFLPDLSLLYTTYNQAASR
jgi:hypothetical protein